VASRQRAVALALLAGLLLAASIPPWGWWPMAFPGIAVLDRLLADQSAGSRCARAMLVAAAWLAPGTLWMWDLTPPGWLIVVVLHSTFFGLAAVLVPAGHGRRLGLVGAITLAEFVRWSVPFGGVPLATLPMGQAGGPLAPVVRVGGPRRWSPGRARFRRHRSRRPRHGRRVRGARCAGPRRACRR
jgi:apolipoprotein N-acyltransferase